TALAEQYYAAVASMAARRPTILGHLDLVTKFNAGNRFFDEDSPRYRAAALEALHAADPWATLLEINTGAVSRG
ncbi:histidinol phosphate phosphatase, partial [Klebsiella oxytoca]